MSAIRPGLPATTLPVPGESGRARQAQSAFFRAAMEAASPASAAASAPTTPAVRPVQTSQGASQSGSQAGAEPSRLLRPGSLLDIRI